MMPAGLFTVTCSLELKYSKEPEPLRILNLSYINVHNSRITLYTAVFMKVFLVLRLMHFNVILLLHSKGVSDFGVGGENIWP